MYYLIEGYQREDSRLPDTPTRVQAVTIQQLAGTIIRMLANKIDVVQVTAISEETFQYFYLERRGGNGKQASAN